MALDDFCSLPMLINQLSEYVNVVECSSSSSSLMLACRSCLIITSYPDWARSWRRFSAHRCCYNSTYSLSNIAKGRTSKPQASSEGTGLCQTPCVRTKSPTKESHHKRKKEDFDTRYTSAGHTMPARLPVLRSCALAAAPLPLRTRPTAQTCLVQQARSASILSSLSDNASAYNKRIRRGRGPASGKGKTSGRGHKGQKQHGKVPFKHNLGRHFGGGQTPEEVVHGKRGFENQYVFPEDSVACQRAWRLWLVC